MKTATIIARSLLGVLFIVIRDGGAAQLMTQLAAEWPGPIRSQRQAPPDTRA